jgi:hypothetical protein
MSENVELSDLDLRYEGHRLQDRAREARLLASIAARGVETPLEGVDTPEGRILLHGFKRWRCARKLQLASVPYVSLARDEAMGILALMGASREKSLSVLEEAKFVTGPADDPRHGTGGGGREVGAQQELGEHAAASAGRDQPPDPGDPLPRTLPGLLLHVHLAAVQAHERRFPAEDDRAFCEARRRQRLSVRDIERLAHLYFRGPESLREAIEAAS